MIQKFIILLAFISFGFNAETAKEYVYEYYKSGIKKAEGWTANNAKTNFWFEYHNNGSLASKGHYENGKRDGYWFFYNFNGNLIKEGHYENGNAENWWIYYEIEFQTVTKIQFEGNQKNGYAIVYKNNRPMRAEKYENGKKTGEWTSLYSFKRDNPNQDF